MAKTAKKSPADPAPPAKAGPPPKAAPPANPAASPLVIRQPANDGDQIATTAAKYTLVVHGTDARAGKNVIKVATVTEAGGAAVNGKKVKQPRCWAVVFEDVPVDYAKLYTIHVEDSAGNKADRTFGFVNAREAAPPAPGRFQVLSVTPGAPLSGASVSGTGFYATGTTDPETAVYSYINQVGMQPYMGSMMNPPPNYVFYFQSVPAGVGYILTVTEWSNPPQSATADDITVT